MTKPSFTSIMKLETLQDGTFTAIQSAFYFELGGYIGSYGTIGTKGTPIFRSEWIEKLLRTQIYKIPFDQVFDELYKLLGI